MTNVERGSKPGIRYYLGTQIRRGTTAREHPVPLRQIAGGSGPIDTPELTEEESSSHTLPESPRLLRMARNHAIYSSPEPQPVSAIRYIQSGGWQAVRDEDKGIIRYAD